jgi:hypothetical protein
MIIVKVYTLNSECDKQEEKIIMMDPLETFESVVHRLTMDLPTIETPRNPFVDGSYFSYGKQEENPFRTCVDEDLPFRRPRKG